MKRFLSLRGIKRPQRPTRRVLEGKVGWEVFEGRAAIGYEHGYDAQKFYLGLALDPKYVAGFMEGCLERIGEDEPEDEELFRDLWEDEGERETVLMVLQAECEVLPGRPEDYFLISTKPRTSLQKPY